MADEADTFLIEFRGPANANDRESPAAAFEAFLQDQKVTFTVEEYSLTNDDVKQGPEWRDWHAQNPGKKLLAVVFLVPADKKAQCDVLVAEFMSQIEKRANPESSVSAQPETGLLLNKPTKNAPR